MKYSMIFFDSCPTVSIDDINNVNRKLGFPIPSQYADFLLQNNGGQPKFNLYKGYDKNGNLNNQIFINDFFSIDNDSSSDICKKNANYSDILKENFIAIGADGTGNIICIGISEKMYNKIYRLYTDISEGGGKIGTSGMKNIDFICDNFEALYKGLVSEDDFE